MTGRFDLFHALDAEKQQRILHAAMEEFAAQGYERASTNTIVQTAGIGKGMLFYYFGSKEELFDFLCEYAMQAPAAFLQQLQFSDGDFLARYAHIAQHKQNMMASDPLLMKFYESLYRDNAHVEKFAARLAELQQQMVHKLYDGLDFSLLRDDMPPTTAIQYMRWLLERMESDVTSSIKEGTARTTPKQWETYYAFLADLKKLFYK
ncbi:MAG: TetR/AcrR family transcriptional regulator [Oscillospiraceae bacterium]|nr:TetR/AcrR family transcriptional regulator [Oscillospiraceae bacterium]